MSGRPEPAPAPAPPADNPTSATPATASAALLSATHAEVATPAASGAFTPANRAISVEETGAWITTVQLPSGLVPWYRGGHGDPWNHVEATMALAAAGKWRNVELAFDWLAANQLPDGSWCTFYSPDGVLEPRRDPNVCAYLATGAWWCYQLGAGREFLEALWPVIDKAVAWCLRYQLPGGEMVWSVGPDAEPGSFALLSASSSFQHSMRNATLVAELLGHERPHWAAAAARTSGAVRRGALGGATAFAPKRRWAMDWYYPVLTGAVAGEEAQERLLGRWSEFVEEGLGVRCVSDRFWVTAAETAECAMAAAIAGLSDEAGSLLSWVDHLRDVGGAYWTGCAHPQCTRYPGGQRSTYSSAAVIIADHVVNGLSEASAAFLSLRPLSPITTPSQLSTPSHIEHGRHLQRPSHPFQLTAQADVGPAWR